MGRKLGTLVILVLIALFAYIGYGYFGFRSANAVSEAAFIKSDRLANLSFKVGGKVIKMSKKENEAVKKGELLAVIDPTDLEIARKELLHMIGSLEKSLDAMKLKKRRLKESLSLKTSIAGSDMESVAMKLQSLEYSIKAAQTRLEKLNRDTFRYKKMLEKRLIASSDFESIRTERDALSDEIEGMKREYRSLAATQKSSLDAYRLAKVEQRRIEELQKEIEAKTRALKSKREALLELEKKIGYTKLYAPFDGVIAKKFVEAPRVVKRGSPIYALVDTSALYCEVLLSEKKMEGVKPGNSATVTVDAAGEKKIAGRVESIAPTSASTFSLVPRDIASGEFTKLDQRFKIRISLDDIEGLRAGMSASVAIKRR